jgi:hypothetical protein
LLGLVEHGLYTVKDQFFDDFARDYWMDNKNEGRPYYYLFLDKDNIPWVIPMSSQVENYKRKIAREEAKRGVGNCIYYHIGLVASRERVFLIGDMFPIDASYIKAPYVIGHIHYVSKNRKLNATIYSKSMRYLNLIEHGVMKSRNDVLGIKRILLNRRKKREYLL